MEDMRRTLLDARPDVSWFVEPDKVYSFNDEPNTCRRVAGGVGLALLAVLSLAITIAIISTGGL